MTCKGLCVTGTRFTSFEKFHTLNQIYGSNGHIGAVIPSFSFFQNHQQNQTKLFMKGGGNRSTEVSKVVCIQSAGQQPRTTA